MIQVRLSHQESRPSSGCAFGCLVFSNYLDVGAGMWGPCIRPSHEAVQRAPRKMLSFNLCNIDFGARHFVSTVGKASPSPEGWTSV